jgi:cytochrome c
LDIDIGSDGRGLPDGRGTVAEGEAIYAARCAVCHGRTGREGPQDVLVGREPRDGFPFGRDPALKKTIGNYWPYATTIYDYVRRAMPTNAPGSLQDDDVYDVVAYLLFLNELIPADAVIDRTTLPKIVMPARDRFVVDPRGGPKQKPQRPAP